MSHRFFSIVQIGTAQIELGGNTLYSDVGHTFEIAVPNFHKIGRDAFVKFSDARTRSYKGSKGGLDGGHGIFTEIVENGIQFLLTDIAEIALFHHINILFSRQGRRLSAFLAVAGIGGSILTRGVVKF